MPATEHRKLAAILFTDRVGYSALEPSLARGALRTGAPTQARRE
jgi:hypothetical protein